MNAAHLMHRPNAEGEIAIVGMACRVPGASDLAAFWRLLLEGREGLTRFSRDALLRAGVSPQILREPTYVPVRGVTPHADCFDARFFGTSPRDAALMDPQHRVFLECAWTALEHAGHRPDAVEGAVGVYAGCGMPSYLLEHLRTPAPLLETDDGYFKFIANDKDFVATRVAWHLGLEGPALGVQTACSTSLVTVISACTALLTWQCDTALAGGVAISPPLDRGYVYREGGILSPDGHCRPFDAGARGTVPSSGVGVVVLKRLVDAVEAGDTVHGIIRGFGINNDGRDKAGFTAPSVRGQANAIAMAHGLAAVQPDEIGYVEAHGTGTPLGDPIEVTALNRAFAGATGRGGCVIGSVKGNIGHLDAAAGVVGLIKATLAARHGVLPGTVHFTRANPEIPFADGPFEVHAEARPWACTGARVAGVSAFGVGGTNAHVVLEGVSPVGRSPRASGWRLWPVSARTPEAAAAYAEALEGWARRTPEPVDVPAVAATLRSHRKPFEHRSFRVVRQAEDGSVHFAPSTASPASARSDRRAIFMFPGQGSQRVGMGRALFEAEPAFRQMLSRLDRVHLEATGRGVIDAIYPAAAGVADAEARLRQTCVAQPALFAVELAWAEAWRARGVEPALAVGHSLGEWVAATVAGVFTPEDAMGLVIRRGAMMQEMAPGAMTSVAVEAGRLAALGLDGVELAAENGPALCVISGPFDAMAAAEARLDEAGIAHRRLHTSHAFHSASMAPVVQPFADAVARVERRPPRIPFVSNVTGAVIEPALAESPAYWARQIRSPVRFAPGLKAAAEGRDAVFVEVGPGRSTSRMAVGVLGPDAARRVVRSDDEAGGDAHAGWLGAVGAVWSRGVELRVAEAVTGGPIRRPAPTYPFERHRHWIDRVEPAEAAPPSGRVQAPRGAPAEWLHRTTWHAEPLAPPPAEAGRHAWLFVSDDLEAARGVVDALEAAGQPVRLAAFAHEPPHVASPDVVPFADRPRWRDVVARAGERRVVFHTTARGRQGSPPWGSAFSLSALTDALTTVHVGEEVRLLVVAAGQFAPADGEPSAPLADAAAAALAPIAHVAGQGHPQLSTCCVDPGAQGPLAPRLIGEMALRERFGRVCWVGGERRVMGFAPMTVDEAPLAVRPDAAYLITGGLGGIGLTLARRLVERGARRLWLTSRRGQPDPQVGSAGLDALRAAGASVSTRAVDVTDEAAMGALFAEIDASGHGLAGVVHAAGVFRRTPADEAEPADFAALFGPKVAGTLHLMRGAARFGVDFVVLCSSMSAAIGGSDYAGYAAANAAMAALARRQPTVRAVGWPGWSKVGMGRVIDDAADRRERIDPAEGADLFEAVVAAAPREIWVSIDDPTLTLDRERRALDEAWRSMSAEPAAAVASDDRLGQLGRILGEALGMPALAPDDDFFDLGGHSLLAVKVTAQVSRLAGRKLSTHALVAHPTPRELSRHLDGLEIPSGAAAQRDPLLVPLNRCASGRRPLFLMHPVGGTVFQYRALASRLSDLIPVFGIRSPGLEDGEEIDGDFDALARRYVEAVRSVQPAGPYRLGGHSLGGAMAYAMAGHLVAAGQSVERVVLIDSPGPGEVPLPLIDGEVAIESYLETLAPDFWAALNSEAALPLDRYLELFRFHAKAMNAHQARPQAPAPMLFFRARDRDRFNVDRPERTWLERAERGLDLRLVDGNHITMVFEPHVGGIADGIRRAIAADDARVSCRERT